MSTATSTVQSNISSQQNNTNLPPANNNLQQQQQQQILSDIIATTTEQLKGAVQTLLHMVENMNRSIIETQNKIVADYAERMARFASFFTFVF
jgi:methionine synthase II (cobalamin-independent)